MSSLTIRTMSRDEIEIALDWAGAEGWNPGVCDAAPFFAADPEGFLIGFIGTEPVAVISAVRYGADFGFIGLYIVKPGYRGEGHGRSIWQAAMARLAGRTIGLDGVVAQQGAYRRSGFHLAHRNVRYEGSGGGMADAIALPADLSLTPLASVPSAELERYDAAFFPAGRSAFLRSWITQPGTTGLGLVRDGRLLGYGVLRSCRKGYKIGPLFADTSPDAESLFLALRAAATDGAPIFLDVPECNAEAVALAQRYGMQVMFETARMYAGPAPAMSIERTFGITSFELG
jgi:ribosomal protein S18 acetylase RimI-like enzyme